MKKSSKKPDPSINRTNSKRAISINAWRAKDDEKPLPNEAQEMLNKAIFELWDVLQESMGLAVIIGADPEQYREEMRHLVQVIDPKKCVKS